MGKIILTTLLTFGLGFSARGATCDDSKATSAKSHGLTFTSCFKSQDGSGTKNLFEITGNDPANRKSPRIDMIIDAAELKSAEGTCDIPCEELDNPNSLKCTGHCSYGWPSFLAFDPGSNKVFFYVANTSGDVQAFTIFAMDLKHHDPVVIGKSTAQKLAFVRIEGKQILFRSVQYKQAVKDAAVEKLTF